MRTRAAPCLRVSARLRNCDEAGGCDGAEGAASTLQPVDANRVVVEQRPLLLLLPAAHDLLQRRDPLGERRRSRTDWPVAAEHHAVWPEHVQRVVDDWRQI